MRHARLPLILALCLLPVADVVRAAEAPQPGTGVHYLHLVRHGIYDRDPQADDVTGNGLNALGHEQARRVGARLAALPVRPTTFVSSTLRRARETADDMGAVLGRTPERDSLISECTPTSYRAETMRDTQPAEVALCDSNLAAAWRKYMTPSPGGDRHDVLVCHGNVIRWFVSRAVSGDPGHWHSMDIGNGSLTVLAVRPDGSVRLVLFSDVGHLPVDMQTWAGRGPGYTPRR